MRLFRNDVNNLRPVSSLPLPGKILENCFHGLTYQYLENNNILINNQGGFRPGQSAISTVANLGDIITQNSDNNCATVATFIDLSKAFDTINHTIFLKKIEKIGFNANTVQWLKTTLQTDLRQSMLAILPQNQKPLRVECLKGASLAHWPF